MVSEMTFIIGCIHHAAEPHLFEVIDAAKPFGALFGLGQRRQKHRRQNGNNGNDDEQFNKGEPVFWLFSAVFTEN